MPFGGLTRTEEEVVIQGSYSSRQGQLIVGPRVSDGLSGYQVVEGPITTTETAYCTTTHPASTETKNYSSAPQAPAQSVPMCNGHDTQTVHLTNRAGYAYGQLNGWIDSASCSSGRMQTGCDLDTARLSACRLNSARSDWGVEGINRNHAPLTGRIVINRTSASNTINAPGESIRTARTGKTLEQLLQCGLYEQDEKDEAKLALYKVNS